MNETYKFSETRDPTEQANISEKELRIINGVGLTLNDLQKLIEKPPYVEGGYALIFDASNSNQKSVAKVWKNPQNDVIWARHENAALRLLRKNKSTQAPQNLGYLHSDDKDKIIIIDWEQVTAGDNVMDISKMFLKLNFTEKQKEKFVEEYQKWFNKDDDLLNARLDIYSQFVLINSILWRFRVLNDEPEKVSSVNEKEFYARVKDNLSIELIKLKKYLSIKN